MVLRGRCQVGTVPPSLLLRWLDISRPPPSFLHIEDGWLVKRQATAVCLFLIFGIKENASRTLASPSRRRRSRASGSSPVRSPFTVGLAVSRSRDLLRRTIKEHVTDEAWQQFAERVVQCLERPGFELDEK